MTAAPLTLFLDAFFCTRFDFRCWVALHEKKLEFTAARVMVGEGVGLSTTYKTNSITARVPGLLHGDFWLAESLAIVEYLEETFPPPSWPALYPTDRRERARARQVMSFLGSDLDHLIDERPSWMITYPHGDRPPLSARARTAADELLAIASRVAADGGLDTWSIMSADLAFALLRLTCGGETLPPRLQALVDENLARPSVASYLDHERPPNPPLTGRRASA
jgi:glutathione S-transferase